MIEPSDDVDGSFPPPYVLETEQKPVEQVVAKSSKKRRRDQSEPVKILQPSAVKVSTYKPRNTGPYPSDAPKLNHIRFTPAQGIFALSFKSSIRQELTVV